MPAAAELADAHEERIQKLEESKQESTTQLAVVATEIGYLKEAINSNKEAVTSGFERMEKNMAAVVAPVAAEVHALAADVARQNERIAPLETDVKARIERITTFKKAAIAVAIGAASILGKEGLVGLWHALGHVAH